MSQELVRCRAPERDHSKPAETQGVFRKFIVNRVDGSDLPGSKHHACEYFVLDIDHDPHAKAALAAYAGAVAATHPVLAADMRERYGLAAVVARAAPEIDHLCRPSLLGRLPPLTYTGHELKDAVEMLEASGEPDALDTNVCIQWKDDGKDVDGEHAPAGWYCWLSEHPEEGSIRLGSAPQPPAPAGVHP